MGSDGLSPLHLPVTLGTIDTVLPCAPTESSSLYLSCIDQCVAYVVDTVYFYPACPDRATADDVVDKLRDALGKILVPYHFMAGRLQVSAEGTLEISCNRAGALFAGATTDLKLADLGDVTHPNPAFRSLVLEPRNAQKMSDNPLLMMQLTKFKCGGFTIGFSMNHAMFDGFGALEFVSNFSAIARGDALLLEPKPDRTILKPRDPPQVKFEHPEYLKLSQIPKESSFTTADLADLDVSGITLSQKHVFKMFSFTADMLNRLKAIAMSDPSIKKCSSFDAIAAHVWQARTKAVDMPAHHPCKVLFAVDIRSRLNPPLPKGFAGNAVLSAFANVPAGELQKGNLSFAVAKIQEATNAITDEYIRSSIDWAALHRGVPNLPGGIFLSAWWKIPFYLMDFGWGKPIYAGPVVNSMVEFVLLLSNGTQEGLNLNIALEPKHMEKFEKLIYDF